MKREVSGEGRGRHHGKREVEEVEGKWKGEMGDWKVKREEEVEGKEVVKEEVSW